MESGRVGEHVRRDDVDPDAAWRFARGGDRERVQCPVGHGDGCASGDRIDRESGCEGDGAAVAHPVWGVTDDLDLGEDLAGEARRVVVAVEVGERR